MSKKPAQTIHNIHYAPFRYIQTPLLCPRTGAPKKHKKKDKEMKEYTKEILKVLDKKEIVSMSITKPQFKNSYTIINISIKD